MSDLSLKRMKKDLMTISKHINKHRFVIKALDGLFLIDLSKTDEGKVTPINEVPKDMKVEIIGANINDIIICGGVGYNPTFIINGIPSEDIKTTIRTINIKPVSSIEEALMTM